MSLAIFNGPLTSIILETFILACQMTFRLVLKTALGMSLLSMISMEAAMNITHYLLTGGAMLCRMITIKTDMPLNKFNDHATGDGK